MPKRNSAICSTTAWGQKKDHQAAFTWYLQAAQAGIALAEQYVASMYEQGDGVTQNDAEAVAWYRKAADQGDAYAMTQLAVHLRLGRGVKWNEAEAMQWTTSKKQRTWGTSWLRRRWVWATRVA